MRANLISVRILKSVLLIILVFTNGCKQSDEEIVYDLRNAHESLDMLEVEIVLIAKRLEKNKLLKIDELSSHISSIIYDLPIANPTYLVIKTGSCDLKYEFEILFGKNQHLEFSCNTQNNENGDFGFIKSVNVTGNWVYWVNEDVIG